MALLSKREMKPNAGWLQQLFTMFRLKNMFVCREQVELCVDILERILIPLSPVFLVQNYKAELQAGLTHPNDTVKILALTQVSFTQVATHSTST